MPDNRCTKFMVDDENFRAMAFEGTHILIKRRWMCPADEIVAAFVDGTLSQKKKKTLENHLGKCGYCRLMVADIIKLQRDVELPLPPIHVAKRTRAIVPRVVAEVRWIWAPVAAMALTILVVVALVLRRGAHELLVTVPASPAAPMVAKTEPAFQDKSPYPETTRRLQRPSIAPVILFPLQGSSIAADQLHIRWKPVPRSRTYEITVVTADGDLIWTGHSQDSWMPLPRDVELKRGAYFVWITAYLDDGQIAKSSPVKFAVR